MSFSMTFEQDKDVNMAFSGDGELNASFGDHTEVSTNNYNELFNKPSINSVELIGDRSFDELGLTTITNIELQELLR